MLPRGVWTSQHLVESSVPLSPAVCRSGDPWECSSECVPSGERSTGCRDGSAALCPQPQPQAWRGEPDRLGGVKAAGAWTGGGESRSPGDTAAPFQPCSPPVPGRWGPPHSHRSPEEPCGFCLPAGPAHPVQPPATTRGPPLIPRCTGGSGPGATQHPTLSSCLVWGHPRGWVGGNQSGLWVFLSSAAVPGSVPSSHCWADSWPRVVSAQRLRERTALPAEARLLEQATPARWVMTGDSAQEPQGNG